MAGGHEGERELPSQRNDPSKEQGSHLKESGISKLLEARNLFSCGFVRPQVVMSFEHS